MNTESPTASAVRTASVPTVTGLRFLIRALRHRNYRLFFSGQSISLIGTWMTRIATSWLVYRLTNSALLLGLVGFAGQFPSFLLAPFAGVLVDRWDRHRLLVGTQGSVPRGATMSQDKKETMSATETFPVLA